MLKKTKLLDDIPATADEFGPHRKIADLIRDDILHTQEGRSIALVGDWGSGKSTVVELLKAEFPQSDTDPVHLFIYDAWSHQGDSLRRAFLDDFITSLKGKLCDDQFKNATESVWNRTETITTTTEPVLRRHAKVLLLTLALVPLGMELFSLPEKKGFVEALCDANNVLAILFLAAPVFVTSLFGILNWSKWAGAKDFLFGESHKEPKFSVLSFFFEKVQGRIERKHVKTPVDSIHSFREVFSQVLDDALANHSDLRVVIVIDNIDRIPPDQAREFWSTMQTFFGESGGLRKPKSKKYWLVAPFSEEALSFLFSGAVSAETGDGTDKVQAKKRAKAYVDKTFGLAFYVPPPILTNWRKYLLGKLSYAFPEHNHSELILVRDAFDFARSSSTITPRDMKLFVNNLVALYRQRGDEIPLHVLSIYILHRDKIDGTPFADDLLSMVERRQIEGADWQIPIAALHFGVGLEEATQILLEDPMRSALREGEVEELKKLENRAGFLDVLRRVVAEEVNSKLGESGDLVAQVSATIGALEGARTEELSGVWRDIRTRFQTVEMWDELRPSTADGISMAITHAPEGERSRLCASIAASLSKAEFLEQEGGYENVNLDAQNWLQSARAVAEGVKAEDDLTIDIHGDVELKIELLQQLAVLDVSDEVKSVFRLEGSETDLSNGLAQEITEVRYPRVQAPLVELLVDKMKIDIKWQPVVKACCDRLCVAGIDEKEVHALINIVLAVGTIGDFEESFELLRNVSTQGHLSNLLQKYRKHSVRSEILAALLLSNPSFERAQQVEQSAEGDAIFNELSSKPESHPGEVKGIAEVVGSLRAGSLLFIEGAGNSKIESLAAAVIGEMVQASYIFAIPPEMVIENHFFLDMHADANPISPFLECLNNADELLTVLSDGEFDVARLQLYQAALGLASDEAGASYINYLKQGLLSLIADDWDRALNAVDGTQGDLLELTVAIRELDHLFELSTPARDAALAQIRKIARGELVPSDELREQLDKLLALLPQATQKSLVRDTRDDMAAFSDLEQIERIIEIVGDRITFDDESSPERVGRRIFSPIAGGPTDVSAEWMLRAVRHRPEFFGRMPDEVKRELGWRIGVVVQNEEKYGAPTVRSLIEFADVVGVAIEGPASSTEAEGGEDGDKEE